MAMYGSREYNDIFNKFKDSREWLNDVKVEIVGDVNELSPLDLLRAYEAETSLENNIALTCQFILNKEVRFYDGNKIIHSFVYNGGDLGSKFTKQPWLIDLLLKLCFGILIKKLTPPSEDSEKEEQR